MQLNLETIAVLLGAAACVFYGAYGLALIATADCTGKTSSERGGGPPLTVQRAVSYCVLAWAAAAVLVGVYWLMAGQAAAQVAPTYGTMFGSATREGAFWRGQTFRFMIATGIYGAVVLWTRFKLVAPLEACATTSTSPTALSVKEALGTVQSLVWVVLAVFALGFVFSLRQHSKFEGGGVGGLGAAADGGAGLTSGLFGVNTSTPSGDYRDAFGEVHGHPHAHLPSATEVQQRNALRLLSQVRAAGLSPPAASHLVASRMAGASASPAPAGGSSVSHSAPAGVPPAAAGPASKSVGVPTL